MAQTFDVARFLKSAFAGLAPDEALRQPPGVLLGVSAGAQAALETLGVRTVFDLGASRVFATARALLAIQGDPTAAEARLNVVAADAVDAPAGVLVTELADQPIAILRGVGSANAPALGAALDVSTVRDLALWPPHAAARAIVDLAYLPEREPGFDPDAPADLLPKSGVYPTERIFYRKLLLDTVAEPGQAAQAIETAEPIDLTTAFGTPAGFQRLATGALLNFSQSWFAQGLTLGQLLHSTSLAPGESTRIAMMDWSRRTRAAASETISETEQLANTMTHSRALSEVTSATAQEFQSGRSTTSTTSTTSQSGGGFGIDLGFAAFGGSGASSTSNTEVMAASSSYGERDLAASYAQNINDRSQQNASSVRNRRASIVREVSQEEHEQISTRVVTNYNHMHALSVQYYEVVQAFRVTTQLERAEKCLFVPLRLVSFREPAVVDRWRLVLADAALTQRTRRQLTVEYGVVEVIPQTPPVTPGRILVTEVRDIGPTRGGIGATPGPAGGEGSGPGGGEPVTPATGGGPSKAAAVIDYRRAPVTTPVAVLAVKGWNIEQLNAIGWATGRVLGQAGSDSVFVSDDALLMGFTLRDGQAARFSVRRRDGGEVAAEHASASAVAFRDPVPIAELQAIAIQTTGDRDLRTALVLQLNVAGTAFPLDVPVALRPLSTLQDAVKFGGVAAARELVDHLEANQLHYSQAIYRALDSTAIAALLAPYTYRGLPLGQVVDPQPVAVTANFLVFRVSVSATGRTDDQRWAAEETAWREWLGRRGLNRPAPKTEIIPLPSGGVFAEAVLGRYNAAEKVDLTRFWNWQDSPIPIAAPDIAPVQAGSRAEPEDLKPGQLSQPVVNIQTPTALPDPTGVGAILTAIQNGNLFRDMSGLAQNLALAQAALQATAQGATAAGEQAGQNMKTVVDANTERLRIAAQLGTAMFGPGAGGGGAAPPGKGTVSERGGELNAARTIDEARGAMMSGPGGRTDEEMPTLTEETFRQQLAGGTVAGRDYATRFADQVMSGLGLESGADEMQLAQAWRFKSPKGKGKRKHPKRRNLTIVLGVAEEAGQGIEDWMLGPHEAKLIIRDDTGKTVYSRGWTPLTGTPLYGVLKNQPAASILTCTAWVRLVKLQLDGSRVVEDLGSVTEDAGPPEFTDEHKELTVYVGMTRFQKEIRFASSESLSDVLAREGFIDPFVKEVSDDVDVGGGMSQVVVTAYSGAMNMKVWGSP
jgi:hypothetical protein